MYVMNVRYFKCLFKIFEDWLKIIEGRPGVY